jgi:preprotein translocase subunit Sec63
MAASHCGSIHDQEEASAPGADLYAVLGLNRECTDAELRVAYRRLAMVRFQFDDDELANQCCFISSSSNQQLQID